MKTVISRDGTEIAYDTEGGGAALILVDGALCVRSSGAKPELVERLATHFSVFSYDRRGRGDSSDTMPYAVEREIEDIGALINEAGGTTMLFGHSSGASLALEAAVVLGDRVTGLALYEAPYNDDPEAQRAWGEYLRGLTDALDSGRPGDAVALFMAYVGIPREQIAGARQSPSWPSMEAVAPTLAYDHTAILGKDAGVPLELARRVLVPTLVLHGDASFPFMGATARTLSEAIPNAELCTLEGQTHDLDPDVLPAVLVEFFLS